MNNNDFLAKIEHDAELINKYLRDNLSSHVRLISKVGSHILLSGGKRLRPILFVAAARMCNYNNGSEYYFSTVFEYLHAATLLHDDVIDNSAVRRGAQTANVLWSNSAAVLVGDFLYSKSFSMAVEMGKIGILDVLSAATNRMAEGMVLELIHTHNLALTEEEYLEIIICKTAALLSAAAKIGGMLGTATPEGQDALGKYGMDLGIAFQLVDDALDYSLSEKEFGKPVGKDIEEGKITLPLMHALSVASAEDRKKLTDLAAKDKFKPERWPEALELVERYGGVEAALDKAREFTGRAVRHLDVFPDSDSKKLMLELADFVVNRKL